MTVMERALQPTYVLVWAWGLGLLVVAWTALCWQQRRVCAELWVGAVPLPLLLLLLWVDSPSSELNEAVRR